MLDGARSFWEDLRWNETLTYRDVDFQLEMQDNVYNFEVASTEMLTQLFEMYEAESKRVIEIPLKWDSDQKIYTTQIEAGGEAPDKVGPAWMIYPALDLALKCSHVFNLLDARGAVGVTQRAEYINRIRARVRACCLRQMEQFKVPAKA
jgi:glycyl-tRNA synthetase alpha chain